jgi:hypothetical protein
MDAVFKNESLGITFRDTDECFVTMGDTVYGMQLRSDMPPIPDTPVPVHVINLDKPLTIVPEPVVEFTLQYPGVLPHTAVNDFILLFYKRPVVIGFIKSVDTSTRTVTILPIAVNMMRGAIEFVDALPSVGDSESLYILRPSNAAYAFYDNKWQCVGSDVAVFKKALDLHISSNIHITAAERKQWSSGGNFIGALTYATMLPPEAIVTDWAIVTSENGIYQYGADKKWSRVHAFSGRDFTADPIKAYEADDSIIKIHQIVDNLESHSATVPLSANMGRQIAEQLLPPNSWEHLFNFGFNRSTTEASQSIFSYENTGATNLLNYTYNGALPKWASINLSIKDDVALFHRSGSVYLRVEAKTADTATFIYGDYHVDTDINMLGILWIYYQNMYTPPFLLLPGMRIRAGLFDPHENQWPVVKESDTGEHKLAGSIKLYLHNA